MTVPTRLTDAERETLMAHHPRWRRVAGRDALERTCRFAGFAAAMGVMTRIAIIADRADHHPEWSNVYDRLTIVLTTHDCDGLSARDAAMIAAIDPILDAAEGERTRTAAMA